MKGIMAGNAAKALAFSLLLGAVTVSATGCVGYERGEVGEGEREGIVGERGIEGEEVEED